MKPLFKFFIFAVLFSAGASSHAAFQISFESKKPGLCSRLLKKLNPKKHQQIAEDYRAAAEFVMRVVNKNPPKDSKRLKFEVVYDSRVTEVPDQLGDPSWPLQVIVVDKEGGDFSDRAQLGLYIVNETRMFVSVKYKWLRGETAFLDDSDPVDYIDLRAAEVVLDSMPHIKGSITQIEERFNANIEKYLVAQVNEAESLEDAVVQHLRVLETLAKQMKHDSKLIEDDQQVYKGYIPKKEKPKRGKRAPISY